MENSIFLKFPCSSLMSTQHMINQSLFAESLFSVVSLFTIYLAVNWSGSYTKYLTERAQRKAFLETRRSLETRFKTQQENERQVNIIFFLSIGQSTNSNRKGG